MAQRDIVVIGTSAGGVEALKILVAGLPADLGASLFIVLHIYSESPSFLPSILSNAGPLPAIHPKDGDAIKQGHIYIAPPDYHLLVKRDYVALGHGARENRHRPSVDPLFRSAARAYGSRVIGIILTGMLDDGTAGLAAVKQAGGIAIAQDPREAMYPGMPQSAIENVDCDYILPLGDVGPMIAALVRESVSEQLTLGDDLDIDIAEIDVSALRAQQNLPGKPSAFACPECGGVLWLREDETPLQFRCRVGHAYSPQTLMVSHAAAIEGSLWASLRTLEESIALSRHLADHARNRGFYQRADQYESQAEQMEKHSDSLREMLRDINLPQPSFHSRNSNESEDQAIS